MFHHPRLERLEDRCLPATFMVTTLNDGLGVPKMTLREAIEAANNNNNAATDVIVFQSTLKGTIALTLGEMDITESLTIKGPGASRITIDAQDASRIFNVDDGLAGLLNVSIRKLSLTGGDDNGGLGGAILSQENLTVVKARLFANHAVSSGGAIAALSGDLTLSQCTIHANDSGGSGGGIAFFNGTLAVTACSFFDNRASLNGGAVFMQSATRATLSRSTFAHNQAVGGGGAVSANTTNNFTMESCAVTGNGAGGGGGGLSLVLGIGCQILNSTIASNTAGSQGGGMLVDTTMTLRNSTVSSNRAGTDGGGIFISLNFGGTTVENCTVAFNQANQGGGIRSGVSLVLTSTIVARNIVTTSGPDLSGAGTYTIANCLIGDNTGANLTDAGGNILNQNPLLGPLASNGGPTQTHALQPGSPAINTGSNPAGLTTDQRGGLFPRVKGGLPDIGAFER